MADGTAGGNLRTAGWGNSEQKHTVISGDVMHTSKIRYFLALRSERKLRKAAQRCGVTQASLARGIKALERELGGLLFEHRSRAVGLTRLGARLSPHFTAIGRCMDEIERAERRILASDRKMAKVMGQGRGARSR